MRMHPWRRATVMALALVPLAVGCGTPTIAPLPTLTITAPQNSATVQGRQVKIEVQVANWKLVDAGSPVATGEGHLHFFVDQPASAVPAGQAIPAGTAAYVHAGKAPYTSRELELTPGQHTITVVMGDSSHVALAQPTPQIVTFTVQ